MCAIYLAAIVSNKEVFEMALNMGANYNVNYKRVSLFNYCKEYNFEFYMILCTFIRNQKKKIPGELKDTVFCSICLENPQQQPGEEKRVQVSLRCKHCFCLSCISRVKSGLCPLCRASFVPIKKLNRCKSIEKVSILNGDLSVDSKSIFQCSKKDSRVYLLLKDFEVENLKTFQFIERKKYKDIESLRETILLLFLKELQYHYESYFQILYSLKKINDNFFNDFYLQWKKDFKIFKKFSFNSELDSIKFMKECFLKSFRERSNLRKNHYIIYCRILTSLLNNQNNYHIFEM